MSSEKAPGEDAPQAASGEASAPERELGSKNDGRTNGGRLHFRVTLWSTWENHSRPQSSRAKQVGDPVSQGPLRLDQTSALPHPSAFSLSVSLLQPVQKVLERNISHVKGMNSTGGKEPACQCRRHKRFRFDPWVGETPCRSPGATHSSTLAWEIPRTEEPGGLQFTGSHRVGQD